MNVNFNRRELQLIRLWWLSCEDMMVPNGTCTSCEFREECEVIRRKLYGKKPRNSTAKPLAACAPQNDS